MNRYTYIISLYDYVPYTDARYVGKTIDTNGVLLVTWWYIKSFDLPVSSIDPFVIHRHTSMRPLTFKQLASAVTGIIFVFDPRSDTKSVQKIFNRYPTYIQISDTYEVRTSFLVDYVELRNMKMRLRGNDDIRLVDCHVYIPSDQVKLAVSM